MVDLSLGIFSLILLFLSLALLVFLTLCIGIWFVDGGFESSYFLPRPTLPLSSSPIDVLLCNQGVFVPQELETQDIEEIKFMIDVNLTGNFHLIKVAFPGMKNRTARGPGSSAIMSSQAGQLQCPFACYFLINKFCVSTFCWCWWNAVCFLILQHH